MNLQRLVGVTILAVLGASGCATVTRGTTEVLVIETSPTGADVALSNGQRCTTPCSLKLKRKEPVVLDITRSGYEPVKVNVLSEVAGAGAAGMAGNVILGGLIGAGVDAATGATKRLSPNPVKVTLNPLGQAPAQAAAPVAAPAPSTEVTPSAPASDAPPPN